MVILLEVTQEPNQSPIEERIIEITGNLSVGQRVSWAILHEASSIKAGNVHPQASFSEMRFEHFVLASQAIGKAFDDRLFTRSIGQIVHSSVQAMVQAVEVNTSLGTILLLAPIALCSINSNGWNPENFQESIASVLEDSTPEDCRLIYQAIRIANPGGLGQVASQDVQSTPPESILEAMRIASDWDDVALQYANGFRQVSQWTDRLLAILESSSDLLDGVRRLQIEILASRPDSLIARKHGKQVAGLVQSQAADVLASGPYASPEFEKAWSRFDGSLRENGHRKNPGTTADLLAAVIYLARCDQDRFDG